MEGVCFCVSFGQFCGQVVGLRLPLSHFDLKMRFFLRSLVQQLASIVELRLVKTLKMKGKWQGEGVEEV